MRGWNPQDREIPSWLPLIMKINSQINITIHRTKERYRSLLPLSLEWQGRTPPQTTPGRSTSQQRRYSPRLPQLFSPNNNANMVPKRLLTRHRTQQLLLVAISFCCLANYLLIYKTTFRHDNLPPIRQEERIDSARKQQNATVLRDITPSEHIDAPGSFKFRQLNVNEFPYKCGMVLYYHIACTGEYHFYAQILSSLYRGADDY